MVQNWSENLGFVQQVDTAIARGRDARPRVLLRIVYSPDELSTQRLDTITLSFEPEDFRNFVGDFQQVVRRIGDS